MAKGERGDGKGKSWTPAPANGERPPFTGPDGDNPGWRAALKHGAQSRNVLLPLADAIEAELLATAPHLAQPLFVHSRRLLAEALAERQLRVRDASEHGLLDARGNPRRGTDRLDRSAARVQSLLEACGLTPVSFARMISVIAGATDSPDGDSLDRLRAQGRAILASRIQIEGHPRDVIPPTEEEAAP